MVECSFKNYVVLGSSPVVVTVIIIAFIIIIDIFIVVIIIIIILINITVTGILEKSREGEFQTRNSSGMVTLIHQGK